VVFRPLLVSLAIALCLLGLMHWILRNWHRAALVTFMAFFLFFTYGHVYNALEDMTLAGISIFRHRTLLPFLVGIFGVLFFVIGYRLKKADAFTVFLNVATVYLLIYPSYQIVSNTIQQRVADRAVQPVFQQSADLLDKPDIYYIILDGYGRDDVLLDYLGYDNSEFLNALGQRGFYIARCSQANYGFTDFSLSSSLNYNYLDVLNVDHSRNERIALLKHNAMRSFLEANGYKSVAFPTGWTFTEWDDADYYLDYEHPATALTEFEILLLDTTPWRIFGDFRSLKSSTASSRDLRRLRVFSLLDNIKKLPDKDEKLFVFAHIVVPHFPYSFAPDGGMSSFKGQDATLDDIKMAYVDQVKFVNREVLNVIDILLARSKTPPIIIVQGDHGPLPDLSFTYKEKMPILNAYYLPGMVMEETLYPSISPVNTFRVIQDSYFGQDLPLLEDRSYYAPNDENHAENYLVPNTCPYQP